MVRRIGIVTLLVVLLAPHLGRASSDDELDRYLQHVASSLPEKTAAALRDIEGTPRRLLAARSYLRAGEQLRTRWSWSKDQIQAHTRSAEYRALLEETEKVKARFEAQNPGYTLYANTEARSLELQITRYNTNKSVGKVAASLHRQALAEIGKPDFGSPDRADSVERFKQFLTRWRPQTAAPLAAPGISRHGQLRAIDFQIMKNGAIVAPTETATVKRNWDEPGWTRKLQAAMEGTRFRGPLQSPYEPWHYEYDP
ncbi:hypothetical protein JM946_04000 [Steroidobacter sp. S1-65]|uniref:Peptidase M15B domain-containing protein n=1 Tax=Steroidobacter gossypii TaxID=2805490 RepID=A0ABS1WSC7_9GAMM|nr:hypothetical protein [Steroidobacter gossypii]MBM0103888.1 hypothetical protein [Steroidobacter gossypii]